MVYTCKVAGNKLHVFFTSLAIFVDRLVDEGIFGLFMTPAIALMLSSKWGMVCNKHHVLLFNIYYPPSKTRELERLEGIAKKKLL